MFSSTDSTMVKQELENHFAYLRETARHYGRVPALELRQLSDKDTERLEAAYKEIERRGDVSVLNEWLGSAGAEEFRVGDTYYILLLLWLFEKLGNLGIEPFSDGVVRFREEVPALDWSFVPEDLRYVAETADKYARLVTEEQRHHFIENEMEPADTALLEDCADKIRVRGDLERIGALLNFERDENLAEMCAIDRLFGLLDLCEIAWEEESSTGKKEASDD